MLNWTATTVKSYVVAKFEMNWVLIWTATAVKSPVVGEIEIN